MSASVPKDFSEVYVDLMIPEQFLVLNLYHLSLTSMCTSICCVCIVLSVRTIWECIVMSITILVDMKSLCGLDDFVSFKFDIHVYVHLLGVVF